MKEGRRTFAFFLFAEGMIILDVTSVFQFSLPTTEALTSNSLQTNLLFIAQHLCQCL